MTISLKPNAEQLDEIVVTGYGITRKAAFTGAAQVIDHKVIQTQSDANFLKSLEGSVAGFQMMNASGQPGAYASTTIRGTNSLNSGTEPLYVIDGVPMYTGNLAGISINNSLAATTTGVNPITNLNANDIESITVLKDATATSIYGARAANGVIVITTKKGKSGKARVNFSAKYGSTFLGQMDHNYTMLGLDQFKEIWIEGIQNGYAAGNITADQLNLYATQGKDLSVASNAAAFGRAWGIDMFNADWDTVPDTDWFDMATRSSMVHDYNVNVQGGSANATYYASLGYYENGGIVVGSGLKRYSGRLNLDAKSDRLGYGALVNISLSDVDQIPISSSYNNPIVLAYDTRPIQPVYNADGSYAMVKEGDYNLVAMYDKDHGDIHNLKTLVTILNPYFTCKIIDGLDWKTNAGLTITETNLFNFTGMNNPGTYSSGQYSSMSGTKTNRRANTYSNTNTLHYNKAFHERHDLNIIIGQEWQKLTIDELSASAKGYPLADIRELTNASTPTAATSSCQASTLVSYFSNFEYNFMNKYYLSSSFRYDGSSRFGKNNRWAPFWSVGGKYRLTSEPFMESLSDVLSDFTLHTSYGSVGNQDIGYYAAQGLYSYGYPYNSTPGAIPSQIENPDLKWETVTKFDVGFNANLLGKVNIDIDFYNQRTKDMIFNVPLTMTSGFSNVTKNVGEMENRGIEAIVNIPVVRTTDFKWDVSLTCTYNKNTIVAMAMNDPIITNYNIQQPGSAVNTFFLKEWAGVDAATGDPLWYTSGAGSPTTTNINSAQQVALGQASPKYYGALGMSFAYKAFDLSFDLNYSGGNKVFNRGFQYDMHCGSYKLGPVSSYVYENRWRQAGDQADVPKFTWGGNTGAAQLSSRYLMDASYARIKNVTLGYNLPDRLCAKLKMDNLRIFASVDNLYTFTAKEFIGFDPQAKADGYVQWAYPVASTALLGFNVGF
jgi:TonB-linked SusC/RagA family outer membrane protein